jgi:hypothetical protein
VSGRDAALVIAAGSLPRAEQLVPRHGQRIVRAGGALLLVRLVLSDDAGKYCEISAPMSVT